MKRRLMVALALALSLGANAGTDGSPDVTDVATVTDFLTNEVAAAVADVRVYPHDEAVALIEKVFPLKGSFTKQQRILHDFAFVFSFSARPCDLRRADEAAGSADDSEVVVYVYQPRVFEKFDFHAYGERATIGLRGTGWAEYVVRAKADGRPVDVTIANLEFPRFEGQRLPFKNAKLETSVVVPKDKTPGLDSLAPPDLSDLPDDGVDVIVVADVESVFFDSLYNLNPSCDKDVSPHSYSPISPVATYRIELLARKVEKGDFPFQRLAFVADPRAHRGAFNGDWPFYRGMTLGVVLEKVDGALRVRKVWPVLPYAPFSSAELAWSFSPVGDFGLGPRSRFELNERAANRHPDGAIAGLAVAYGHHTFAKFLVTVNGIEGAYGSFPDYARETRMEVWTASEGAEPDYWRTAWFADGKSCKVFDAEDGLDARTRLEFDWAPFNFLGLRVLDFRGERRTTLGALARRLERATVCDVCGRNHYQVSVDGAVANREVTISREMQFGAFMALELACERAGCVFAIDGTNIVVSAELADAELADESLTGRLKVLEQSGFASVAGARYANVSFWRRDTRFDADPPVGKVPGDLHFGHYALTGNGWIRESPDGQLQTLVFNSGWWSSDERAGFYKPEKARLTRDVAKVRAYLRHAADDSEYAASYGAEGCDAFALAFALHLFQNGHADDAQALYVELMRRPAAARVAFTALWRSVKDAQRDYPDFETWLKKSRKQDQEGAAP